MTIIGLIQNIVKEFDVLGLSVLDKYVASKSELSNEISIFKSDLNELESILLNENFKNISEVIFNFSGEGVLLSDMEGLYGEGCFSYNFRENCTEVSFSCEFVCISKLFFVLDNHLCKLSRGFSEKTPRGKEMFHENLLVDHISIRVS